MKKVVLLFSTILITISCQNQSHNPIEKFQKNLVNQGITGSNVAQVYKDGEIIYNNTIFPIWSMSKTVTTVAMMILLDEGKYNLNDNVADYLPEYKNIKCKGPN